MLELLYLDKPDNLHEAFEQGMRFLNGGEKIKDAEKYGTRLYSFDKDANFIMAAFRQTHGVDLETENMHWWKFLALFMDLGGDTTFSNLVRLRKRLKNGKASKEERATASEIREIIDLPENEPQTLEELEALEKFKELVKRGKEKHVEIGL